MPVAVKDSRRKGAAPDSKTRAASLLTSECPHKPQTKNCCKTCIAAEIDEAVRRALISRGLVLDP